MFKLIIIITLLFTSLYSLDFDFDGVENKYDKCKNTSFLDTVNKDGCPDSRLYFGIVSLEYEYSVENTSLNKSTINSMYINIDYKQYLFSYFKNYYEIDSSNYTGDNYFSIGYSSSYNAIFNNKSYLGIKKANKTSQISSNIDDYFLNSSFDYSFNNNLIYNFFIQYTFVGNDSYTQYNNYFNYSLSALYYKDKFQYSIYYINSGSTTSSLNKYQSIKTSILYNFTNTLYSSISYNKSILNGDNTVSINVGYSFD